MALIHRLMHRRPFGWSRKAWACLASFGVLFSSCSIIRESPKYQFADGTYTTKGLDLPTKKVYVDHEEAVIRVYPLTRQGGKHRVDTGVHQPVSFTQTEIGQLSHPPVFQHTSFDLDFLTIPFKYRFPVRGFPRQFNANLNGAVYLGRRTDVYVLHYEPDPLGRSHRQTNHFGFSVGGFLGFGGTAMNPWVTQDQIAIEYDGLVWTKGVAGIVGVNKFTIGLALGWDHLLDANKEVWLYQNKPWLGFALGLNLN